MPTAAPFGLDIIVSWRDRPELARSLPSLRAFADKCGGQLTVVNYGGDSTQLMAQLHVQAASTASQSGSRAPVRVLHVGRTDWFNKARAQNIGAAQGSHALLFFCDADIVIPEGELDPLVQQIQGQMQTFGTVAGVTETVRNARQAGQVAMFGYRLQMRLTNGRTLEIVDHEEDAADGRRQAPGLLMVRREDFLHVGGYNGQLHGWGWEDQDMIARLTLGAGLRRLQHGQVLHLSHDDQARMRHYPPMRDRWESRDRMFRQALSNYDQGLWSGTYLEDAACPVDCQYVARDEPSGTA